MERKDIVASVIAEDAFGDESKDYSGICLDVLKSTREPHFYRMRVFDSIKDLPVIPHTSWEYIYAIEIDGGRFIKIGFSKNVKSRIKSHVSNSDSPFHGRCGRIGLLGPIRDGLNTEQMIHEFMGGFYAEDDFPNNLEVYSLDAYKKIFSKALLNDNIFDTFCGLSDDKALCVFDTIQWLYYLKSNETCIYSHELIVPRTRYV